VHGVVLNKHLWRHQLAGLSDIRRCIAVDLLAHGDTEIAPDQDVSVTANAKMLKEVLDALKIDQVDLVGNDSGGGIAQIFAALNPERVRTLTLTNCDTHDNWPPEAFKPFVDMVKAGGLRDTLNASRRAGALRLAARAVRQQGARAQARTPLARDRERPRGGGGAGVTPLPAAAAEEL
jgi:pimeloyl-ACP methyl ester carboxylesterase